MTPERPPANVPQMEIAQLHQTDSLQIEARWRLPYYTSQATANLPEMEITLGHQRGPCQFIPDGDYPTPPNSTLLIDPDGDCPTIPNRLPVN